MSTVKLQPTWQAEFTTPEMSLIRRALREELRDEDVVKATELESRISHHQISQVEHLSGEFTKLKKNIQEGKKEAKV